MVAGSRVLSRPLVAADNGPSRYYHHSMQRRSGAEACRRVEEIIRATSRDGQLPSDYVRSAHLSGLRAINPRGVSRTQSRFDRLGWCPARYTTHQEEFVPAASRGAGRPEQASQHLASERAMYVLWRVGVIILDRHTGRTHGHRRAHAKWACGERGATIAAIGVVRTRGGAGARAYFGIVAGARSWGRKVRGVLIRRWSARDGR